MRTIQAKNVVKYVLLPGVVPRVRDLFTSGFGYTAFLMASIYNMVRLLPAGHPYLNPQNIGRFGIRHVMAEAANNLELKWENFDQFVVFFALLAGFLILVLQFILILYGLLIGSALANPAMFVTQDPEHDIAFILLDRVFGIPGLYNSCVAIASPCPPSAVASGGVVPWDFHNALHDMFQFYSTGLLLIAVLIFLYFVVVVVLETAATGSPFGQRFQNVWVPIRLVVAVGLLIPMNWGLSASQYITLYSAKLGSSFATNGWLEFNDTLSNVMGANYNPSGEPPPSLVAIPSPPTVGPLVQSMALVHACAYIYWKVDTTIDLADPVPPFSNDPRVVRAYFVKQPIPGLGDQNNMQLLNAGTQYPSGRTFYDNGDILIRFGREVPDQGYAGDIEPTCGEIRVRVSDLGQPADGGGAHMQEAYFREVLDLWFSNQDLIDMSHRFAEKALHIEPELQCNTGCGHPDITCNNFPACLTDEVPVEAKQTVVNPENAVIEQNVLVAWNNLTQNTTEFNMTQGIRDRGWAGAGIWYTSINQVNGDFTSAVMSMPMLETYPWIMEKVREAVRETNSNIQSGIEEFNPGRADDAAIDVGIDFADSEQMARVLYDYLKYWTHEGGADLSSSETVASGNVFTDGMNLIFGTGGMMSMRGTNAHVHPLAQLSMLGKGLVDSAVMNVAGATAISFASPFMGSWGGIAGGAGRLLADTALIGLTAGFVLYYVLPFLPFLYFYFAVGSWVKEIFEAMVGAPLWALAHLRLDGEGLPGTSAANGYFLMFGIFVRPILTVVGLVAAMTIFAAQVRILNFIWDIVVHNVGGYQPDPLINVGLGFMMPREAIDEFFYTVVYAIIVYMLATSSFKLIDRIPDNILRWMNAGTSTFSDINEDPTEGLTKYAALGGLTVGSQVAGGLQQLGGGTGGALNRLLGGSRGIGGLPPTP